LGTGAGGNVTGSTIVNPDGTISTNGGGINGTNGANGTTVNNLIGGNNRRGINSNTTDISRSITTSDNTLSTTEDIDEPDYRIDKRVQENNPFVQKNMDTYEEDTTVDKNYFNVLIYVRFQTNMDKLEDYLADNDLKPKIKYSNVYFLERIYATKLQEIKKLNYVERVFELNVTTGQAPKKIRKDANSRGVKPVTQVYRSPDKKQTSPSKPYTPPKPNITLERSVSNKVVKSNIDNKFSKR
ncbi:MAG: hypothetical protein ACOCVF_03545, partial [bacterium]